MKIMENPIKMDDLGVPLFSETSMSCVFPVSHICSLSTVTIGSLLTCQVFLFQKLPPFCRKESYLKKIGSRLVVDHPGRQGFYQGIYLDVSENSCTPKSSILIGFSIINHPFWGTPIFGNTHLYSSI